MQPPIRKRRSSVTTNYEFVSPGSSNKGQDAMDRSPIDIASPPQSLSHFSSENIAGLVRMMSERYPNSSKEYDALRFQDQLDLSVGSKPCSSTEAKHHEDFLAFCAQSINYVLSDVEALLKSFLHRCHENGIPCNRVSPYRLAYMTKSLKALQHVDSFSSQIFPSLWICAGYVHPSSFSCKGKSGSDAPAMLPAFLDSPLNDVEASHLVKIVFAALAASISSPSLETMYFTVFLRASGSVVSPEDCSEQYKKLFSHILDASSRFQDEMALKVAKRIVGAAAARHYTSKRSVGHQHPSEFFDIAVDYLFSNRIYVNVLNDEILPSVKGGKLTCPNICRSDRNAYSDYIAIIEWLKTIIVREWDGKAKVPTHSVVAGALELLTRICQCPPF